MGGVSYLSSTQLLKEKTAAIATIKTKNAFLLFISKIFQVIKTFVR
jgi:hypothetical protein